MAGPAVIDPAKGRRRVPNFGTATREDVAGFVGIMRILHSEPNSAMFARLLDGSPQPDDELPLAHIFEEISTLALHNLVVEDLLFDAFAIDLYFEQLRDRIVRTREKGANPKFCENFEAAALLAAEYRELRPKRLRET